jgi:maltose/maltodextrin transport system substrate-binding protein
MIWAHDRLGEWADTGLLMPVDPSPAFRANVFPVAWEAFTHRGRLWGFPIAMEATTLIYNRALITEDQIPADLADVRALVPALREKGAAPILWDYNNTYFTWGLLASGGAQIFGRNATGDYDPADVHIDDPSAVAAATLLVSLLQDGTIARSASYSVAEAQMNQGRLAMFISGPFAWENLAKSGIDFGIARIPGLDGAPGRPFVGVLGAMFNRSSPNLDLAQEFLEHWLCTPAGIAAMDAHVPVGVPALRPAYDAMSSDPHVAGLMSNIEVGTLMPNIPQMGAFWSAMETALNTLTTFRDTPASALSTAASRLRSAP